MSLFSSTITGNVLNDGETPMATIEVTGVTAGQLATVLTQYTPLETTTSNTASIGTNSAAVAALQTQVAAIPAPPDLTPYALAADLAAAEGLIAANQSSITSLSTSLTTGLAGKANQSALDALQLDVDGKSTPASVDLKLANHPTNASMNSAITSANNATLATVAANYGLKSTQDQQALDIAARQTAADVCQAIATALLPYTDTSRLNSAVALRTTPADVDQKIATALLPLVAQTALDAALALRDGRLDAAEAALATLQAAGFQSAADVAAALATALAAYTDTAGLNGLLAVRDARLDGARRGDPGPAGSGALRHLGRPLGLRGEPPIGHRRAQLRAGRAHHGRRHEPRQRPGVARADDLGPPGGHQHHPQPALQRRPPERLPRERQLHAVPGLRRLHAGGGHRPPGAPGQRVLGAGHPGRLLHERRDQRGHHGRPGRLLRLGPDGRRHRGGARALLNHRADGRRRRGRAGALQHHGADGRRHRGRRGGHRPLRLQHHRRPGRRHRRRAGAVQHHRADGRRHRRGRGGHRPLGVQHRGCPGRRHRGRPGALQHHRADGRRHRDGPGRLRALDGAPGPHRQRDQHRPDGLLGPDGDSRYFPTNGNVEEGGIYTMVLEQFTPRMIRALLPPAPLSATPILGNGATLRLNADCYSKAESDSRYATPADLDVISCTSLTASSFVNTLNFAATGNVSGVDALFTVDVQTPLLRAVSGDGYLRFGGGLVGLQFLDSGAAVVDEMTSSQIALEQDVNVAQSRTLACASIATTGGVANLAIQGGTQGIVCTSKGLNVTENFPLSANPTDGNVAVRVENTAPTGFAMLEMSANGGARRRPRAAARSTRPTRRSGCRTARAAPRPWWWRRTRTSRSTTASTTSATKR